MFLIVGDPEIHSICWLYVWHAYSVGNKKAKRRLQHRPMLCWGATGDRSGVRTASTPGVVRHGHSTIFLVLLRAHATTTTAPNIDDNLAHHLGQIDRDLDHLPGMQFLTCVRERLCRICLHSTDSTQETRVRSCRLYIQIIRVPPGNMRWIVHDRE